MSANKIGQWLTLGATFGVLIGIFLLVAELNQNTKLMRAQIFNERATQGVELFVTVADSPELSKMVASLNDSGLPENVEGFTKLTLRITGDKSWKCNAG